MTEPNPFPNPVRQSPAALVLLMGTAFKLMIRQFWAVLLLLFLRPSGGREGMWDDVVSVFLMLSVGNALVRYLTKRFHIRDQALILETGWLRRRRTLVPMERIQSVSLQQSVVHRLFGVMAVDIDTAGSLGQEFRLEALPPDQAHALQRYVGQQRSAPAVAAAGPSPPEEASGEGMDFLYRLSETDLVKVGMSRNHLRTAGVVLVFLASFANDLMEAVGKETVAQWQGLLPTAVFSQGGFLLLVLLPLLLGVAMLATLLRTFMVYHGLTVRLDRRHIRMEAGWFARTVKSVELEKIQWVDIRSTPLLRHFGLAAVHLPQAVPRRERGGRGSVSLPGCHVEGQQRIVRAYWPVWDAAAGTVHGVDRRIILRQVLLRGIFPLFVLWWPASLNFPTLYLVGAAVWLPLSVWWAVRYHRTWNWEVHPDGLRIAWGVVNRRTVLLKDYKVQVVRLHGSRWLRRAGYCHLTLVTAAGPLTLPYLAQDLAQDLADRLLFRIESDNRAWM